MTDDPRIKGFCFWKAGTILKYRDTALANDDFRELYAVMPELVKNNWFKSAKEVPDDFRNMNDKLSFFKSPAILLSWKFPFPTIPQTDISTETGLKLKISSLHYDNLQVDIDSDLYALHLAGDKGLPEGYIKCGLYYHQQSYYGMAASYLKKALDVKPDSNLTRYLLGCSLLEIGMWTEGVSLVQYVAEHEQTSQTLLSVASKQMATFYQKGLYGLAPDLDKAESYRQNILFKHHIYRNH